MYVFMSVLAIYMVTQRDEKLMKWYKEKKIGIVYFVEWKK